LIDGPEGVIDANSGTTNYVQFSNFAWDIEAGDTTGLLIKCSLHNSGQESDTNDTFNFVVATDGDITAEDSEGDDIDVNYDADNDGTEEDETLTSGGNLDPATYWAAITTEDVGTLTVAAASDNTTASIILGNSTDVTVAKYKFTAAYEDFTVKKVTFANSGTDSVAASVKVSYTNSDGDLETKSGSLISGAVAVTGMDMVVAADSSSTMTVMVDTSEVGATKTASAATFNLTFDSSAAGDFDALGSGSGTSLTGSTLLGSDPTGNTMTLYKTKPTISLASGSPSGGAIPGYGELLRFNISADSRGYVTVDSMTFKATTTDNASTDWAECDGAVNWGTAANWDIFKSSDSYTTAIDDAEDWLFDDSAGDGVACGAGEKITYIQVDLGDADGATGALEIEAGDTETLKLFSDTTGASSASDDSIRIDIPSETLMPGTAAYDETAATWDGSSFVWEDDNDTDEQFGTYVKTLTLTGGTIAY